MDIEFLVDRLEEHILKARKVPMRDQVMIEREFVLEFVDQMRAAIPEEIRAAKRITQESERVIANAKEEADHIIAAAQEQAALLLQESGIRRQAKEESERILARADAQSEETMRGADQYAADVLRRLESDIVGTLATIRSYVAILDERLNEGREREGRDEDQRRTAAEAALRGDRGV